VSNCLTWAIRQDRTQGVKLRCNRTVIMPETVSRSGMLYWEGRTGMEKMRPFFDPKSVALVGATDRRRAVGQTVMNNLLAGQRRHVYLIDREQTEIAGLKCYPSVASLPESPDLVVVAGVACQAVPQVVAECGRSGVRAMVIVSAGVQERGVADKACEDEILVLARGHGIRIFGPNCMGVIRPDSGLNATFATRMPKPGHIAFISQSGAMGSAVLDWAVTRGIGLSAFVSLGSMLDVDFGELIDYLGEDSQTRSIMVYLESLGRSMQNTRRFISAARGLARSKPIVVIKAGRFQDGSKAMRSCSAHVIGEDLYYQAILERAGAVRVDEVEDLFNCASILNTALLPRGRKVAIVSYASGLAVVATDALISRGGELARLSAETISSLNQLVPPCGSRSNPIEIPGDATPETAAQTIEIALSDPGVSGAVVLYTPQGAASPMDTAEAIVTSARIAKKPILAAMMGSEEVAEARRLLYDNNVPTYEFPEDAVKT
jgi:acetyltransferase